MRKLITVGKLSVFVEELLNLKAINRNLLVSHYHTFWLCGKYLWVPHNMQEYPYILYMQNTHGAPVMYFSRCKISAVFGEGVKGKGTPWR